MAVKLGFKVHELSGWHSFESMSFYLEQRSSSSLFICAQVNYALHNNYSGKFERELILFPASWLKDLEILVGTLKITWQMYKNYLKFSSVSCNCRRYVFPRVCVDKSIQKLYYLCGFTVYDNNFIHRIFICCLKDTFIY